MLDRSDPVYRFYIPIDVVELILLSTHYCIELLRLSSSQTTEPQARRISRVSALYILAEDDDERSQKRRRSVMRFSLVGGSSCLMKLTNGRRLVLFNFSIAPASRRKSIRERSGDGVDGTLDEVCFEVTIVHCERLFLPSCVFVEHELRDISARIE